MIPENVNREEEFRGTILAAYESIGRRAEQVSEPEIQQWLLAVRIPPDGRGWTGEQLFQAFAESDEGVAFHNRPKSLAALRATGHGLQNTDSKPFPWCGLSMFRALDQIRLGQDISHQLDQAADCGVNIVRVLMDASWFVTASHRNLGEVALSLYLLSELLVPRHMYGQICLFADWQQVWGGDRGRALEFYHICVEGMRPNTNLVGQDVNEGNQHGQDFPFGYFPHPPDILFSLGSKGTGENPPSGGGSNAVTYHSLGSERRPERASLCTTTVYFAINGYSEGDNWPGTQWDTVVDEPYGIGTPDQPGKDRRTSPGECYLLGAGTRFDPNGRACGGNAHTDDSIQGRMMDAVTEACVRQFIRGVRSVTL